MLSHTISTHTGGPKKWKQFGFFLTIMLWTSSALCQSVSEQYVVDHWTTKDGLPVQSINKIIQSQEGYLWIATYDGLVRFDGVQFKVFTSAEYPGLPSNRIIDIREAQDGSLRLLTVQGFLVQYKNGIFKQIGPEDGLNGSLANAITTGSRGYIWIGSDKGISVYKNGVLSAFKSERIDVSISHIYIQDNGAVWFSQKRTGMVYRFFKDSLATMIHAGSVYEESVNEREGWLISSHHVFHNGEQVYFSPNTIMDHLFDREGSLWLGTYNDGLYRLKPNPFTVFNKADGLTLNIVYPIIEARDGSIWVGTHGNGVARIKNGKVEPGYLPVDVNGAFYIRTLCQKQDGTILMGMTGLGIWQLKGHSFVRYPAPKKLANTTVASIFEDSKGRLWVGSAQGVYLQIDNRWKLLNTETGFPDFIIFFFIEAPDGSIWMATNGGGIVHYYDKKFRVYNEEDGLSSNLIRALHIEPSDEPGRYMLWIGSEDNGLSRLPIRGKSPALSDITHYREQDGLFDNAIHRILEDDNGFFWMSSNRGIFRVAKQKLQAFANGKINRIRSIAYTEKDGLPTAEANGGMQPAGIKSSDGRLWFPTQEGVVVLDPDNIVVNERPPPVIIETVTTDGQPLWNGYGADLKLEKGTRDFEISYTALSLLVPAKNRFRYKLEGFDEEWHTAGTRRTAFYTNIPPGNYTFLVLASNNSGVWNEKGAALNISVVPFFYETNWFYVLCALGFLLLVFGLIQIRTRRLAAAEKHLTALVEKRTHDLRIEKNKTEQQSKVLKELDEAKSRFFSNISHEFRTPLTLIMNPLKQLISGKMGDFSTSVSKYHHLMLRNSYRMHRLIDQLLDLAKLNERQMKLNIEKIELISFTATIYELFELTAKEEKLAFTLHNRNEISDVWVDREKMEKVLANLFSNAIKYTEPGGTIDIRFRETAFACQIQISDTGLGISENKQQHIFDRFYQAESGDTRRSEGVGIGLALVKEFVELHEGEIILESEKGKGSCFTVILKKGRDHFDEKNMVIFDGDRNSTSNNGNSFPSERVSARLQQQNSAGDKLKSEPDESRPDSSRITPDDDKTTVMVVEDNDDLRAFLSDILSERYRVFEAGNGQTALDLIHKELPDLIVADIMMPGMDGRTLNLKLKEDPALASIPLIFLTAKSGADEKIEGFEEGADGYLTKPFDANVLLARIDNLIESRMRLRKLLQDETVEPDASPPPEIEDPFLLKTDEALEAIFSNPELTITELAENLHIDRSNLYRNLKEKTGLTTQQYVTRFRLEKAAILFREQRGSVSEIAYAVGFNSLSWFTRQFREQFGVNPSEYLAEIDA